MLNSYRNKNHIFLWLLVLAHIIAFCAAIFVYKRPYSFDSAEYFHLAENLGNGFYYSGNASLPIDPFFLTLRPPVYSLFILACWTFFGYHTWVILLFQNIISILNCLLVKTTFEKIYPDVKKSSYYWILVLGFPMQFVFANMIFADVLMQCFLMLYFRELLFFIKDKSHLRLLKMSLWLTLALFTKPIVFPFLFIQLVFVLIISVKRRQLSWIGYALIPIILLFSYAQWNKERTGLFHISSVQSVNLLTYNLAEFYQYKYGVDEMRVKMKPLNDKVDSTKPFKVQYNLASQIAKEKMKEQWASYAMFHIFKSMQLFFDPNKLEFDIFSRSFHYENNYQNSFMKSWRDNGIKGIWNYLKGYPYLPFVMITPLFGLIRIIGFILFLFDKRNNWQIKLAVLVFVLYFALITGPVANARYFMPIVLIVSACAWIGFAQLYARIKSKSLHATT